MYIDVNICTYIYIYGYTLFKSCLGLQHRRLPGGGGGGGKVGLVGRGAFVAQYIHATQRRGGGRGGGGGGGRNCVRYIYIYIHIYIYIYIYMVPPLEYSGCFPEIDMFWL